MNQTEIKCVYYLDFDNSIDLDLDITIPPMIGDVYLHWDGETFHHLIVTKRQYCKRLDETTLFVTFKNRNNGTV